MIADEQGRLSSTETGLPKLACGVADRTGPRRLPRALLASAILLMLLSGVDAVATLVLLRAGCEEVNPAMHFLLSHGVVAFLIGKFLLTGLGAVVLVAFRERRLFRTALRTGHLLVTACGLYAILNTYQFVLLIAVGAEG